MATQVPPGALTVRAAAQILGLHPQTVRALVRGGQLVAMSIGPAPHGRLRIPVAAMVDFSREARLRAAPDRSSIHP